MTPREGDRLRTVARIVCLFNPPTSSALPPLQPVLHPAEDRVNSSLRSLHLAGTQSCSDVYVCLSGSGQQEVGASAPFSHMIHYRLDRIKGRSENYHCNQSERLTYDLSCPSGLQNLSVLSGAIRGSCLTIGIFTQVL